MPLFAQLPALDAGQIGNFVVGSAIVLGGVAAILAIALQLKQLFNAPPPKGDALVTQAELEKALAAAREINDVRMTIHANNVAIIGTRHAELAALVQALSVRQDAGTKEILSVFNTLMAKMAVLLTKNGLDASELLEE